jgi:glycosyltransferase involved in cell wall biosynthesis
MKPSILFFVPEHYSALERKGVEKMALERNEGGFFDRVITIHPFCLETRLIALNEWLKIYELGFDLIPGSKRLRLFRYLQYPTHFFRVIWTAIRLIKKNKIDLIRANDPYWMGLFGYICSRICGLPFCVSIHADYDKIMALDKDISISRVFGSYRLAKQLEVFILSKAAMIMPISIMLGEKAAKNGVDRNKINVCPHGMDMAYFEQPPRHDVRRQFHINPKLKIISVVSRLSPENYTDDVTEIARRLGKKRKDFIIVIAGGGKNKNKPVYEEKLEKEISSDPFLADHVALIGFHKREFCIDLRRSSAVSLVLMSGFSLIEACVAGNPIVAYDVGFNSELVINEETGFLVNENDIDGAVNALDWLLDHPADGNEIGRKAKKKAFNRHELERSSAVKVKCYSKLLPE